MKKFYLLALAVFCLMSCQQEELASNGMYSDDFMSKLKFKTVITEDIAKTRDIPKGGPEEAEKEEHDNIDSKGEINVLIFSVRIARASKDCLRGFGFCDFRWFPGWKDFLVAQASDKDLYESSFKMESDGHGNNFVDVELAENSSSLDITKLQPLVVEEELESYATINNKEEVKRIPQGTYPFNRSIGKFGGYRVPIK